VKIVDEFTAAIMEGRAERGRTRRGRRREVRIQEEPPDVAPNPAAELLRQYDKLAGDRQGEAGGERSSSRYTNLNVVEITHENVESRAKTSRISSSRRRKASSTQSARDIKESSQSGPPVLVGRSPSRPPSTSSSCGRARRVKHNVRNAKEHAREDEINQGRGSSAR